MPGPEVAISAAPRRGMQEGCKLVPRIDLPEILCEFYCSVGRWGESRGWCSTVQLPTAVTHLEHYLAGAQPTRWYSCEFRRFELGGASTFHINTYHFRCYYFYCYWYFKDDGPPHDAATARVSRQNTTTQQWTAHHHMGVTLSIVKTFYTLYQIFRTINFSCYFIVD